MWFSCKPTTLQDAKIIQPQVFGDERWFFLESYKYDAFVKAGIADVFIQDNHSMSMKWVLRWLHMQTQNTQSKLIRVVAWSIYDVIVDTRKDSSTYGKREWFEISAKNNTMLYIPKWFAHWFLSLEDNTQFLYKCDAEYDSQHELVIAYDDPQLAIDWNKYKDSLGIDEFIVSKKDSEQKILLKDF